MNIKELTRRPDDPKLYKKRKLNSDGNVKPEFIQKTLPEVENIQDTQLKRATVEMLSRRVNTCMWEKASSSTGKYHPDDEIGWAGLLLHVRRVVQNVETLLRCHAPGNGGGDTFSDYEADKIRVAAILHDGWKYGKHQDDSGQYTKKTHPKIGYEQVVASYDTDIWGDIDKHHVHDIAKMIKTHHGTWTAGGVRQPESLQEWIIHHADVIASRPYNEGVKV